MKRATSTIEVGRAAGVSHMTVARVFSGKQPVSEETRQRVLEAARALNYSPHPLARGLRGGVTKSIGILWSLSEPEANAREAASLAQMVRNHNYLPFFLQQVGLESSCQALDDLQQRGVDGIIVQLTPGLLQEPEFVERLADFRGVVLVTSKACELPYDQVVHNRLEAFHDIAKHFAVTGRKRPAFLGALSPNTEKWETFVSSFAKHAQDRESPFCINLDDWGTTADACQAALDLQWQDEKFPFDCVSCTNDELAAALMDWLEKKEIKIPADVAVTGVNNSVMTRFLHPPLASVERRDAEMVACCEKLLFRRLATPKASVLAKNLHMRFVLRASAE